MQVSAEIRWFWRDVPPPNLEEWFRDATEGTCAAGGGEKRVDDYLCDHNQSELSLKRRGGKAGVEVKGLVAAHWSKVTSDANPFVGPIELWTKWSSEVLDLGSGSTIPIEKIRWLRTFDTGKKPPKEIPVDSKEKPIVGPAFLECGCNVELTGIKLPNGAIWWTLGFESWGAIQTLDKALRDVAKTLAARRPPQLETGLLASYPVWLKDYVVTTERVSANE
jgi:hypothetical protein